MAFSDALPPSYDEACCDTISLASSIADLGLTNVSRDATITFVDFVPKITRSRKFFPPRDAEYEPFR